LNPQPQRAVNSRVTSTPMKPGGLVALDTVGAGLQNLEAGSAGGM
jgi:hypothetical protein